MDKLDEVPERSRRSSEVVVLALAALLTFGIISRAWVGDDAFISLRTLDNWVNGYGLRFNVAERVQAYTHPLWLFLLALPYALTREPLLTTIAANLAVSAAAFWLMGRSVLETAPSRILFLGLAATSTSLLDYSTSGLENPLTHLLLTLLVLVLQRQTYGKRETLAVWAIFSGLVLSRPDAFLLGLPSALVVTFRCSKRGGGTGGSPSAVVLGLVPLLAWEAFSLVYYGSLVANTAIAKTQLGFPRFDLVMQGLAYVGFQLHFDPFSILILVLGLGLGWRSRTLAGRCLVSSAGLYLAAIVFVGGDFMAGRFFTAPLWLALYLCASELPRRLALRSLAPPLFVAHLVAYLTHGGPLTVTTKDFQFPEGAQPRGNTKVTGIVDEKTYYRANRLFRHPLRNFAEPRRSSGKKGRALASQIVEERTQGRLRTVPVVPATALGMLGYYAGPSLHVLDEVALTDPLLSRLPAAKQREWRVGHYARRIPFGYRESLANEENRIADRAVRELYDRVRLVTRAPLWSKERFAAILSLAGGSGLPTALRNELGAPGIVGLGREADWRRQPPRRLKAEFRTGELVYVYPHKPITAPTTLRVTGSRSVHHEFTLVTRRGKRFSVRLEAPSGTASVDLPSEAVRREIVGLVWKLEQRAPFPDRTFKAELFLSPAKKR